MSFMTLLIGLGLIGGLVYFGYNSLRNKDPIGDIEDTLQDADKLRDRVDDLTRPNEDKEVD